MIDRRSHHEGLLAWRPRSNPWLIAISVTLAAFMEILDTTIVNVALPHIAGSLAASINEATWTLTCYLAANGVVLTVSGWISDTIGRKRYFLVCIAMFTLFSFLCGTAQGLGQLIVFRTMQGVFGGGMQPNQQAIILDTFPPARRAMAFGLTAAATIAAPVLGPTLGGYIIEQSSWRWIFFINVPVGIIALISNLLLVEDPPWEVAKQKRRQRGVDYVGLSLITVGISCLQVMIDRGEDDDWFGSPFIRVLALLTVLGIGGAITWLLTARRPIVNLDVFLDRNFATGCFLVASMGAILYGSSVLLPQFMQNQLGYTAFLAGLVLSPGGIVVIIMIPIVGYLMKNIQTRFIIMLGFFFMGCALFYSGRLTTDVDFTTLVYMRSAQTAALGFLFVHISTTTFRTLPPRLQSDGTALYAMVRNVFGSIGISLSTAAVQERFQANQAHLAEFMTSSHQPYNNYLVNGERVFRTMGFTDVVAHQTALGYLYATFLRQAAVLAYSNVFRYISVFSFLVVPICFLLIERAAPRGGRVGVRPVVSLRRRVGDDIGALSAVCGDASCDRAPEAEKSRLEQIV